MREEDFLALKKKKKMKKMQKEASATPEKMEEKKEKKENKRSRDVEVPAGDAEAVASEAVGSWEQWNAQASAEASSGTTNSAATGLSDQHVVCKDCGEDFIFTVGEQQFFLSKGYEGGKSRCAACTSLKKARFGEKTGKGTAAAERAAKTTCFTCGQVGHNSKQCTQATCFNCGKAGHRSKDCKEPRDNRAGGGVCFKFQSGSCTRGDTCRFAHVLET